MILDLNVDVRGHHRWGSYFGSIFCCGEGGARSDRAWRTCIFDSTAGKPYVNKCTINTRLFHTIKKKKLCRHFPSARGARSLMRTVGGVFIPGTWDRSGNWSVTQPAETLSKRMMSRRLQCKQAQFEQPSPALWKSVVDLRASSTWIAELQWELL